jgi:hypothetical protein
MGTGFSSKIGSSKKYSNLQQRYEENIYAYYKAGTGKKANPCRQTDPKIDLNKYKLNKKAFLRSTNTPNIFRHRFAIVVYKYPLYSNINKN